VHGNGIDRVQNALRGEHPDKVEVDGRDAAQHAGEAWGLGKDCVARQFRHNRKSFHNGSFARSQCDHGCVLEGYSAPGASGGRAARRQMKTSSSGSITTVKSVARSMAAAQAPLSWSTGRAG
jgi:hypothetical protein